MWQGLGARMNNSEIERVCRAIPSGRVCLMLETGKRHSLGTMAHLPAFMAHRPRCLPRPLPHPHCPAFGGDPLRPAQQAGLEAPAPRSPHRQPIASRSACSPRSCQLHVESGPSGLRPSASERLDAHHPCCGDQGRSGCTCGRWRRGRCRGVRRCARKDHRGEAALRTHHWNHPLGSLLAIHPASSHASRLCPAFFLYRLTSIS